MKYHQKIYPPLEYQQMLQVIGKGLMLKKKLNFDNSILIPGASECNSGWNNQRAEQWQTHRVAHTEPCFKLPPRQQTLYSSQGWALPFSNYTRSFKLPLINN